MPCKGQKPCLIIVGASGHGRVVADIAKENGFSDIVFLDDDDSLKTCNGYEVIGKTGLLDTLDGFVFVAIGNAKIRRKIMDKFKSRTMPVLVHPSAVVANGVKIGDGSVVMAGAVINPGATLGKGTIVNTCSSVDHDCKIGDFVHVAVGAHVCGSVEIGDETWIGAGSIVSNNLYICGDCMIGAGAVTIKDIRESGTYIGVPAKLINS